MPIGNLTSQIFSNIYLNELDRFVKHELKVKGYLRYGDDFLLFEKDKAQLELMRDLTLNFLAENLQLSINANNDVIVKARQGLKYLGVELWTNGRYLKKRNRIRVENRLSLKNLSSYSGLIRQNEGSKMRKWLDWKVMLLLTAINKPTVCGFGCLHCNHL